MKKIKLTAILILGGVVGFVGGFFGGGGGMVTVPMLEGILGLETKKAHATTMLIILPMSLFAGLTYFFKGTFDLPNTLTSGSGVFLGGIMGAFLLKKLNSSLITLIFSVLMIVAGIKMII